MELTIHEDGPGRRYFASEVARVVVQVGGRLWLGTVVLALGCLLLRFGVQLSPRAMVLTRALIALPVFLALAVPLSWLVYRYVPCSCTIDSAQFRFRGRGAGRYPFGSVVSYTVDEVSGLPGYRLLALRVRGRRLPVAIVVPDSIPQDVLSGELSKIAS
jgi:hypothetical protein